MAALCWTFIDSAVLCYAYVACHFVCDSPKARSSCRDTDALTLSVDWIKRHFRVAFSSNLSPKPIFHQSALSVKASVSAWRSSLRKSNSPLCPSFSRNGGLWFSFALSYALYKSLCFGLKPRSTIDVVSLKP